MLYCTFLEFGAYAIEREAMWFTLAAVLSTLVTQIDSEFSQLAGRIIQAMFCGDHDPTLAGIMLECDGEFLELFYKFAGWLLDGLAQKCLWGTKGETGTRLCVKCLNLFAEMSAAADPDFGGVVCAFHDKARLIFSKNRHIYVSMSKPLALFLWTVGGDHLFIRRTLPNYSH
jgi:hypothetical protein